MNPEMQEFLQLARFHAAAVEEFSRLLPQDDAELDGIIAKAARENDLKTFMFTLVGALHAGRKLDARLLSEGALLMPAADWIGAAAFRMTGDVPEHLMDALRNKRLEDDIAAQTIFIVAAWCQEQRGGALPEGLITQARLLARTKKLKVESYELLLAVALQTKDEGLKQILRARSGGVMKMPDGSMTALVMRRDAGDKQWQFYEEQALEFARIELRIYRKPIIEMACVKPSGQLNGGVPLRRAAARVGRNEPCPCGSGKKYKHCCIERDHERLLHSSPVAGRTQEEILAETEPHLTRVWIEKAESHEVARFDPSKIALALLPTYFERLIAFNLFDRATEAFEKVGCAAPLDTLWKRAVDGASGNGRKDLVRRLVDLRGDGGTVEKELEMASALLLAKGDAAKALEIFEAETQKVLKDGTSGLKQYATGLLRSDFRGVGILVARGVAPFLSRKDAAELFESLLQARDRLNLPPEDPFEDLLDRLFLDQRPEESKETVALREAQRRLGEKVKEVGQLKEGLERLQRDLARREKAATEQETLVVTPAVVATEESALKELREKVEGLREALKERHQERNDLRRELQKAHADLEELRKKVTTGGQASNGEDVDEEEDLLLPQDKADNQPIRWIEFPHNFTDSLASLPRSVARGTMTMLGRLAAGEPAAFVGAVRLKACPSIMRQRIGIDFRLLFRLLPDRVQVVALIPRQDLERKIKTLL